MNQRIHPMTIVQGWRTSVQIARAALEANTVDHSLDQAAFREDLLNIARTTLSSKLLHGEKDHFARLAVDAVLRLKGSGNLDYIQVRIETLVVLMPSHYCFVLRSSRSPGAL